MLEGAVEVSIWFWLVFHAIILGVLALDLGVFHRKAHVVSVREALTWTVVWIALALSFNAYLWLDRGNEPGLQFLTGYVIEKSLSVDNIFVFVLIFSYFAVPAAYQHRVLFWGILGALVMRGAMIAAGSALLKEFHWVIFIFGAFLAFTGVQMLRHRDAEPDPNQNIAVRLVRRLLPVTDRYDGQKFFVRNAGKLVATPLFLALVAVEFTDLVFAVDSIPAIFAITDDAFIVYTSNIFAILGLRSLYFALSGVIGRFAYLKTGLAVVLIFVGAKMLASDWYKMPPLVSLAVILSVLTGSIVISLVLTRRKARAGPATAPAGHGAGTDA
jgi:tellurite resistance protein TerC